MVAAPVEHLRHLDERPLQAQRRDDRPVGVVVGAVRLDAAERVGADDPVEVVAPGRVEQAPQPGRGTRVRGVQGVGKILQDLALLVDQGVPAVRQHHVRPGLQHPHALLEQLRRVQVVVRGPLEVPPAGLADQEVVVRRGADVDRLAQVPDPRVALRVVPADLGGVVGRRVVGDDQLEVLVGLRQQRVERLGEVLGTVVDGQADRQGRHRLAARLFGCSTHDGILSGCPERLTTAGDSFRYSASPLFSWYHHTNVARTVATATPQQEPRAPSM